MLEKGVLNSFLLDFSVVNLKAVGCLLLNEGPLNEQQVSFTLVNEVTLGLKRILLHLPQEIVSDLLLLQFLDFLQIGFVSVDQNASEEAVVFFEELLL